MSNESLEALQRRRIAESLGVTPEEITDEFLDNFLEKVIYPIARFNIPATPGLQYLTRNELDQIVCDNKRRRAELREEVNHVRRVAGGTG